LVVYHFSSNQKNIEKVRKGTTSGSFVLNDSVVQMLNCHLPFGGVGASGFGRYHGVYGFMNFSNLKSICKTQAINPYPLNNRFAPYSDSKKRTMTFLLKIGGTTYESLGRKFKYVLLAAAGIGVYVLQSGLPKL
jgi:aldehyde dehydrogenase (NAD+)